MTKRKERVRCEHADTDRTASGHCRLCDRRRREQYQLEQNKRAAAIREAALAHGLRVGPHREQDEAGRVNRILELMDQHWRASTVLERAELDAEIRRLSRMG